MPADATKRVLYAQLVAAESTTTVMATLWSVLVTHGLPLGLYTNRASWAFYTPKAGQPVAKDVLTQVGRPWPASTVDVFCQTRMLAAPGACSGATLLALVDRWTASAAKRPSPTIQ